MINQYVTGSDEEREALEQPGEKTVTLQGPYTLIATGEDHVPFKQPESVPQSVMNYKALVALDHFGLLDQVETLMSSPDTPLVARLAWERSPEFYRNSPTVMAMASALSLTDEQLDELFIFASQVVA